MKHSPIKAAWRAACCKTAPLITAIVLLAAGCQHRLESDRSIPPELRDFHERISFVVREAGYKHHIISERDHSTDVDTVIVPLSVDGVRRKEMILQRMLTDVASISGSEEYRELAIRIELIAVTEKDVEFMEGMVQPRIGAAPNVQVDGKVGPRNQIQIDAVHKRVPVHVPRAKRGNGEGDNRR